MRRLDLRKAQAARLNTIRDINRQIVLTYVREREPISRAEIARETELQRSTVSAIVEDLTREGLIEEVGEGESTGGRRPTMLKLRAYAAGEFGHMVIGAPAPVSCSCGSEDCWEAFSSERAAVTRYRKLARISNKNQITFKDVVDRVGGEIARAWDLIESALTEAIEHSVRRGLPSARILPSTLGDSPTLRGALSLVLASKFAAAFAA